MIQLLIILLFTAVLSLCFKKKSHEMLPVVLMTAVLFIYSVGVVLSYFRVNNALLVSAVSGLLIAVLLSVSGIIYIHKRQLFETELIFTPQIIVCVITCLVFTLLFSTHKVMHWDDLSYWGIYAKDLFFLNRIPFGVENCTIQYKDYTPIVQILQYFFMFNMSSFNETAMFQINVCFMYILMLPFLDKLHISKKSIWPTVAILFIYVAFPHIFTTQFYYKLGVDYLMSLLFGYGIYWIVKEEQIGVKFYVCTVTASFLILSKTSGVILVLLLSLFYGVVNADTELIKIVNGVKNVNVRKALKCVISCFSVFIIPIAFYLSWKLWGRRTGNHGYLSDKVSDNVRGIVHSFPSYSKEVIINYIKHFFVFPLTRERVGITAAIMVAIILIMYYVRQKVNFGDHRESTKLHILILIGLLLFCIGHLYMYLFVFDDWEAYGLLEFDRYINQYLAGALYFYLYNVVDECNRFTFIVHNRLIKYINPIMAVVVLFAVLLPYPSIKQFLVVDEYDKYYSSCYTEIRENALNEWNNCVLSQNHLPLDEDHRVMIMADAWSDKHQFLVYEMCPQAITVVENLPALETGRMSEFCRDLIKMNGIEYVYVSKDGPETYQGDFYEESRELNENQSPLEAGVLYEVKRIGEDIYLE